MYIYFRVKYASNFVLNQLHLLSNRFLLCLNNSNNHNQICPLLDQSGNTESVSFSYAELN